MKSEGKVYEALLNKNASKWSKLQTHLFIKLLWNLDYRGEEMLGIVNSLSLVTPRGKSWSTTNLAHTYSKFNRSTRDPEVLKILADTLNKIIIKNGRTVTPAKQTSFDDYTPTPVMDTIKPKEKEVKMVVAEEQPGVGKTTNNVWLSTAPADKEILQIQEILASNLSAATKKAVMRGILASKI